MMMRKLLGPPTIQGLYPLVWCLVKLINAESVYMFGSDCFVVTVTRDINVNDRIVLYVATTNGYVVESRGSICKL